jgi:hypothetical protein
VRALEGRVDQVDADSEPDVGDGLAGGGQEPRERGLGRELPLLADAQCV